MDAGFFLKGVAIGFAIAAPVGPIGILCIRRTLAKGRLSGFVSGLGAALADALYGGVAGFGLHLVANILIGQQFWIRLMGGALLCYIGFRVFTARTGEGHGPSTTNGLAGDFTSTFLLTLTNPATILSFAAVFAAAGLGDADVRTLSAGLLVLGVFVGSGLWWLTLSSVVGFFRHRFNTRGLGWVNRISGLVIAAFGILAMVSARM
jgi:threonine/homoserine/homoserine lactone efflux protein